MCPSTNFSLPQHFGCIVKCNNFVNIDLFYHDICEQPVREMFIDIMYIWMHILFLITAL